ncbi:MAG: NAD(P)/FAD-dependent oxidoreductase [Armatimonadota bacterium]
MPRGQNAQTVVIGAGPAGLAAARELALAGRPVTVLEQDQLVGGLSRTVEHDGFRFDIGGHRFFTKIPEVERVWDEVMGDDFLVRERLSRIFFRGRLMDYPLKIGSTLRTLGLKDSLVALGSYLWARIRPLPENSFEGWVGNRFGRRLYQHFFKTYTEKVWGMPCTEISADWAAQRIKSLSLWGALRDAILRRGAAEATSLLRQFKYPRLGPGMMYEGFRDQVVACGGKVRAGRKAVRLVRENARIAAVVSTGAEGEDEHPVGQVISSMPLRELIAAIEPAPPEEVMEAAQGLRQRGFLTVALIIDRPDPFPDQWIYIHEPQVQVGRIQNYRNWSPYMVPDEGMCCIGMEYFAWPTDPLWSAPDAEIIELATREIHALGLIEGGTVVNGAVVRMADAYPVYDEGYRERVATVRRWLDGITNLQTIGRGGQHRYNNMDHSIMTGMLAARNVMGEQHDIWAVNVEEQYLERR